MAIALAFGVAFLVHWGCFQTWGQFHTSIDFNKGPFEDFTGPYYRQALAMGEGGELQDWFLYPPSFAVLLSPLGYVAAWLAPWIWLGVLTIATALCVVVGLAFLNKPTALTTFLFSLTFALGIPWVHDMHWGQVSTLLWALTLCGMLLWTRGSKWGAALCLSVAIAIKVYPAWFLLAFAIRGDWKGIARIGVLSVAWLILLPLGFMGPAATELFYRDLFEGWRMAFDHLFWKSEGSQFAPSVLDRLWNGPDGLLGVLTWVLPYSVAAWIVWQAARCLRSGSVVIGLVLLAAAMPWILSPSWLHYFVWLPWGLFVLGQRLTSHWLRGGLCLAAILMSTPFFLAVGGHPAYPRGAFLLLASGIIPLTYALAGGMAGLATDDSHPVAP